MDGPIKVSAAKLFYKNLHSGVSCQGFSIQVVLDECGVFRQRVFENRGYLSANFGYLLS